MKILKVEFENINSLAGHWCIDFTDASYNELDHSLFVINGETGVGKSSILDAITLALYGATPRQGVIYKKKEDDDKKKASDNSADGTAARASKKGKGECPVMTKDKGNCFARVTYQCKKGTFVSEWSQRRGNDKASGGLQDAQYAVYRVDASESEKEYKRTGAKEELAAENTKHIQLDYAQFCRSVMLAQGEFNKFLDCEEGTRAAILEKLNGTERFRLMAVKVGDHTSKSRSEKKEAQAAYDSLAGSMPKAEDVEKDRALLAELGGQEKELANKRDDFEKKINWRKSVDEAKDNLKTATKALDEASECRAKFAESELRLKNAEKARECATLHTELQGFRKRKEDGEKELGELLSKLPFAEEELKNAREAKSLAGKEKNAAEQYIADNEKLWTAIRLLDGEIVNATKAKDDAEKRKKDVASEFDEDQRELSKAKESIQTLMPRIENLKQTQIANGNDAKLVGVIPQSKTLIENIRGYDKDLAGAKNDKIAAEKDLSNAEDDFKVESERKQELLQEQQELFQKDFLVLVDVIQKHLEEGAPCPVCGSKEHPACSHLESTTVDESRVVDVAAKIRELNSKMQESDSKLSGFELKMTRARTAENAAVEKIESLNLRKKEAASQVADLWKPWVEFDIETADDVLADLELHLQRFNSNQADLEGLSGQLAIAEAARDSMVPKVQRDKERLETESESFEKAVNKLNSLCTQRMEKFGDQKVDKVVEEATRRKNRVVGAYDAAEEKFRNKEKDFNELNTKINSLKDSLETVEAGIQKAEGSFKSAIEAKGFATEATFLAAYMPETEYTSLQEKKKSIDTAFDTAKGKHQVAMDALEKLKAQRSDETQLEVLLEEKKKVEEKLTDLQKNSGAAQSRINIYEQNEAKLQQLQQELEAKKADYIRWETMSTWFGVKDGSDFATFVQGLTFRSLLKLANKHLQIIRDRFRLVGDGSLNFKISDAEFGEERDISNLSGGEKFMVSLSLALGIADFASRNVRIESLFMDEGFGTLDSKTLEDVMSCLRSQQRQGKMLGVITHVESVVKSINQRIDVTADRQGHSVISGPGVQRLTPSR